MRYSFILFLVLTAYVVNAQSRNEKEVIERTYLLSHTVFGTKDSVTLEDLFAKPASYGHSHGNIQTREKAIAGISHNQSTYTDTAVSDISIIFADDVAIVRHLFKAIENTKDG